MTDLKVLQEQAEKWLADATDAETFAKGALLLKSIDEQKKLRAEEQKLIADTETAKVDAENGRRFWTTKVSSLAPMFAAIITGLTFGLTYIGQQRQSNVASQQGEEWARKSSLKNSHTLVRIRWNASRTCRVTSTSPRNCRPPHRRERLPCRVSSVRNIRDRLGRSQPSLLLTSTTEEHSTSFSVNWQNPLPNRRKEI